jgi:hypothetical protein
LCGVPSAPSFCHALLVHVPSVLRAVPPLCQPAFLQCGLHARTRNALLADVPTSLPHPSPVRVAAAPTAPASASTCPPPAPSSTAFWMAACCPPHRRCTQCSSCGSPRPWLVPTPRSSTPVPPGRPPRST